MINTKLVHATCIVTIIYFSLQLVTFPVFLLGGLLFGGF